MRTNDIANVWSIDRYEIKEIEKRWENEKWKWNGTLTKIIEQKRNEVYLPTSYTRYLQII